MQEEVSERRGEGMPGRERGPPPLLSKEAGGPDPAARSGALRNLSDDAPREETAHE